MGWSHETQVLGPVLPQIPLERPSGGLLVLGHPICGPTISCCPGWGCWTPLGLGWESRTTHQEEPENFSSQLLPLQYTNLPKSPPPHHSQFHGFWLGSPTKGLTQRGLCEWHSDYGLPLALSLANCWVNKHPGAAAYPSPPPCAQKCRDPAPSLTSSLLSPGWGVSLCPELIPSGLRSPFPSLPLQSPSASLSTGSFCITSSLFHLTNTHLHASQCNYKRESILKHWYEEVTLSTSDCILKMKYFEVLWIKIQLVRWELS